MAETLRIATFNTELSRKGPGLLLRDLRKSTADIAHVLSRMSAVDADIWVLQDIDYDHERLALGALAEAAGLPFVFAAQPNTGLRSGADLDGDGRIGGARDAHGYGWFSGQGGIALLSRFPLSLRQDLSALIWSDVPWATLPERDGEPFLDPDARAVMRLSSTAHWRIDVALPGGTLTLLTAYPTPPVFDGPEDRNGLRNADEIALLREMMREAEKNFVVIGDLNLDPERGAGRRDAIRALLSDSALAPDRLAGRATVDFGAQSAGRLRVSYALASRDLKVIEAGIAWQDPPFDAKIRYTRHHPVWIDIDLGKLR
ncbi:MAG: endonuclease/exonuclease/phosphatase family protein [Pseudomonadota bacterium]